MAEINQTHQKLASVGKWFLGIGIVIGVLWFGVAVWSKYQPAPSPQTRTATARQQMAMQQQRNQQSQGEDFTLYPGQGKILVTNFKDVVWKTAGGACLVRERNRSWYGRWKHDRPDRGTPFDNQAAHAIEFWVPRNFPGPVTIIVTIAKS